MTRDELNKLFQKYLFRIPTDKEWSIHRVKNYAEFEEEILGCNERNILLENQNSNVGKIAILLTGHIRKNSILNGLLNFLKQYNCDVFIHTWDNIGLKGSEINLNDELSLSLVKLEIEKIPNVKKFEIENNKKFIESLEVKNHYFNYSSPEPFIKSQLYSINKTFLYLKDEVDNNKTKYNAVFKFRFDCEFMFFNLNKTIIDDVNNHNIIFVPNNDNGHTHPDNGTSCMVCDRMYYNFNLKDVHIFEHSNIVCDLFAYGSYESMKKYCSLYDYYDEINESYFEKNKQSSKKHNKHLLSANNEHKLLGNAGHIDSVYYYYCSYPERMLQLFLKDYMLIESINVKLKLIR